VAVERRAPTDWHVIRSIARRELGIAARRKLVRLLFLFSALPPLILGVILVVRVMAERATGTDLGWDPVERFLLIQAMPVALLALGLGTPLVARDRSEDVLYLYAVRPVMPWHYTLGKMLAVALPTFGLLVVPGFLIAVLRQGVMPDRVGTGESVVLVAKVAVAAFFMAAGYAGVSVGPSAATKRARWALLIAAFFFMIPDSVAHAIWGLDAYAVGPGEAAKALMGFLFSDSGVLRGLLAAAVLSLYAAAGATITMRAVRREMIP
jgi:ABC-type transport system involved in multi-copper enzyme maturation permease subunit